MENLKAELNKGLAEAKIDLAKAEQAAVVEATKIKNEFGREFEDGLHTANLEIIAAETKAKAEVKTVRQEVAIELLEIEQRTKADVKSIKVSFMDDVRHISTKIKDLWFSTQLWIGANSRKVVWGINKIAEAIFNRTKKQ